MSMRYAQGCLNPKFLAYGDNALLFEETFPECNQDGLIERHTPITHVKTDIGYNRKSKLLGWQIDFTLHYNRFVTKETLLKFKRLVDLESTSSRYASFEIIIIPRVDFLDRRFSVFYSGDDIEIGIMGGRRNAPGNRLPIIRWSVKSLYSQLSIVDPEPAIFGLHNLTTK